LQKRKERRVVKWRFRKVKRLEGEKYEEKQTPNIVAREGEGNIPYSGESGNHHTRKLDAGDAVIAEEEGVRYGDEPGKKCGEVGKSGNEVDSDAD